MLLKYLITFLRCIRKVIGFSDSIEKDPRVSNYVISTKSDSQFAPKISDFWYLPLILGTGNEMVCYKERHPLLLKWFITFH